MIPIRQYQVFARHQDCPFWNLVFWGNGLDSAIHVKCLLNEESGVMTRLETYLSWRNLNDPKFKYLLN